MVVGEIPEACDLLIVGGGPAGYVGAIRAAALGRRVLLVERNGEEGLGGACLHTACIPSKALIEIADATHRFRELAVAGLSGSTTVDLTLWQAWCADLVSGLLGGIRQLLHAAGVAVVAGELRFTRGDQAVLDTPTGTARYFQFTDVLIATGSRPTPPPGLQPDGQRVVDSTGLLAGTAVPPRLVVVGAGCVGVEYATALAKLGSRVTLIEAAKRPLPDLDAALVRPVLGRLRDLGVDVLVCSRAESDDGEAVRVLTAEGPRQVPADTVLVATGRVPNTDQLGLHRLGITPDAAGRLAVGPDRRLSRHVAAAGDITPGPALAHTASAEALVAVAALSGRKMAFDPQALPIVVFSDPQLATTGLTAAQARALGTDVIEAAIPVSVSGRARVLPAAAGVTRLVADATDGTVLGVHISGPQASELIGEAVLAIEMGATIADLAQILHPHPTLSELGTEAARLAVGLPVLVPSPVRPRATAASQHRPA